METKDRKNKEPRLAVSISVVLSIVASYLGLVYFGVINEPSTAILQSRPYPSPESQTPFDIRLAWFSRPPKNDDMLPIAVNFDFIILSAADQPERDLLRTMDKNDPILQYLRFEAINIPATCTEQPRTNQVAYLPGDYCQIDLEHPDWFLLDQNGERIITTSDDADYVLMDPGSQGWREFFLSRIRQENEDMKWDGVFLDVVEVTLTYHSERERMPANYPTEELYQEAIRGFLKYLYEEYFHPNNRLLYANIVARGKEQDWSYYLDYLDGAMLEGWALHSRDTYRPVDIWEKQMDVVERTQAMGKTIILVSPGQQFDQALQEFAFASYLLVNNGNAIFRYANSKSYREIWMYNNYNVDLGSPLGPRYLEGNIWQRNFQNGFVTVNPVTHEGNIVINH